MGGCHVLNTEAFIYRDIIQRPYNHWNFEIFKFK